MTSNLQIYIYNFLMLQKKFYKHSGFLNILNNNNFIKNYSKLWCIFEITSNSVLFRLII